MNATTTTARHVFHALRTQPALAAEAAAYRRCLGRAEAAAVVALRLGCGLDVAAAGLYRYENPKSRAEGAYFLAENSANGPRRYGSALGGVSPTWCGKWPITRRVREWCEGELAALRNARDTVAAMVARGVVLA